jgi:hypothetical protein
VLSLRSLRQAAGAGRRICPPTGRPLKEDHTGAEEEDDGKEENSNNRRQDDFGEDSQDCRDLLMLDEHFVDSGK